jgi:hypothetical protein
VKASITGLISMLKKIRALINGTEAYDMNKYVNEGMSLHIPEQGELSELFFLHDG